MGGAITGGRNRGGGATNELVVGPFPVVETTEVPRVTSWVALTPVAETVEVPLERTRGLGHPRRSKPRRCYERPPGSGAVPCGRNPRRCYERIRGRSHHRRYLPRKCHGQTRAWGHPLRSKPTQVLRASSWVGPSPTMPKAEVPRAHS